MTIKNAIEFLAPAAFALAIVVVAFFGLAFVLDDDPLLMLKPDIYIISYSGSIDKTKLSTQGDIMYSYRYPFTKIGLIILNSDGTIDDSVNKCWGRNLGELKHNMQTSCKRTMR